MKRNRTLQPPRGLYLLLTALLLTSCTESAPEDEPAGRDPVGENARDLTVRTIADDRNGTITIAFYNVENLFDTRNDPDVDDDEFTPRGPMKWTDERLEQKMEDLARAVGAIDDGGGPDILGLCEVENRSVLERFTADFFPGSPYRVIHEDSPDRRGIDVALLYRPDVVTPVRHRLHTIDLGEGERPTRSVLEVEFEREGGAFNVLVNHWPSRSGGERQSRWKRKRAADVVHGVLDSIARVEPGRDVVIIGDFNDTPLDRSLRAVLGAGSLRDALSSRKPSPVNLAWTIAEVDTFGTYLYGDEWDVLDQIIITPSLLDNRGLSLLDSGMTIVAPPFLRDDHPSQPMHPPRRTFIRRSLYIGGTSDHFPVFARFAWR